VLLLYVCNRDWFDIYKTWDEGFVMLANNLEFNVVGIGVKMAKYHIFLKFAAK